MLNISPEDLIKIKERNRKILKQKKFSIDVIISEYNTNNESFHVIKRSTEIIKYEIILLKTFNKITSEVRKYIKKEIIDNINENES